MVVRVLFLAAAAIFGLGPGVGLADEPPTPQPPPSATEATPSVDVHRYGDADATCREWGNGCQICLRQDDGAIACSTPGIACLPKPTVCTARK